MTPFSKLAVIVIVDPSKLVIPDDVSETYSIAVRGEAPVGEGDGVAASAARDDVRERATLLKAGVPLGGLAETTTVTGASALADAGGNVIDCAAIPALVSPGT